MAVAYVSARGTGENNTPSNQVTFSTTGTISAGNHVVVIAGANNGGLSSVTSVTVGALSLSLDHSNTDSTRFVEIWSAPVSSEIASGATVTVVYNATGSVGKGAACVELSGVASSSYEDASADADTGFSANYPSGTASNTVTDAFAIAGFFSSGVVTVSSLTNSWTAGPIVSNAGDGETLATAYKVLSGTGSQSTTVTFSGSTGGVAAMVIYKGAVAPAASQRFRWR